jgi:hypothetical protein
LAEGAFIQGVNRIAVTGRELGWWSKIAKGGLSQDTIIETYELLLQT